MYDNINFENSDYKVSFTNIQYDINIIDPVIELKRYVLYQNIKKDVNKILKENKILKKNKINIDVDNILPRFIMNQFKNKSIYIDPIFPYNADDYKQLKGDLYYLSKKKLKNDNITILIYELDLKNKFNNAIINLKAYILEYTSNIENYKYTIDIQKTKDFIYLNFDLNKKSEYLHDSYKLNKFKLHTSLYNKLLENYLYTKNDNNYKKLLTCLLLRYNILESNNQQLSINPEFKNEVKNKYKINFELFSSSINCEYNNYCSLFYDIEKNFKSKGNFSTIKLKKGFYISNPPFDEELMKDMSSKFVASLKDKNNEDLSILITIPYWIDDYYGKYESYFLLKDSGFITYEKEITKENSVFFDYYLNKYVTPCKIFLIVIQNEKGKIKYKIDKEFDNLVTKYFSKKYFLSKQSQKGGENNINKNLLLLELNRIKNIKFNMDVKIKNYPPEYKLKIAKEFYLSRAKYYYNDVFNLESRKFNKSIKNSSKKSTKKEIISNKKAPNIIEDYINYILNLIITKKNIENLSIIDLSYNCEDFKFIEDRSKKYYDIVLKYLLNDDYFISTNFNFIFNPLFNLSKTNNSDNFLNNLNYDKLFEKIKNKQDLVIISGTLEYFSTKSIQYYLEQCQSLIMFIQIYYLINILNKNGSFIMFCWTLSTKLHNEYILLLSKFFDKVFYVKNKNLPGNTSYLVGKNFHLLNKTDLNKINTIFDELKSYINESFFGTRLNVKDKKIRKEKYILKTIHKEDSENFIHKLFNLDMDNSEKDKLIKKINNFHNKLFEKKY